MKATYQYLSLGAAIFLVEACKTTPQLEESITTLSSDHCEHSELSTLNASQTKSFIDCSRRSFQKSKLNFLDVKKHPELHPDKIEEYLRSDDSPEGEKASLNLRGDTSSFFKGMGIDSTESVGIGKGSLLGDRDARYVFEAPEDVGVNPNDSMTWSQDKLQIKKRWELSLRAGTYANNVSGITTVDFVRSDTLRILVLGDGPAPLSVAYNKEEFLNLRHRNVLKYQCWVVSEVRTDNENSILTSMSVNGGFGGMGSKIEGHKLSSKQTIIFKKSDFKEYYWRDYDKDFIGPKWSEVERNCGKFHKYLVDNKFIEDEFNARARNWVYSNPQSTCLHDGDCLGEWRAYFPGVKAWTVPRCIDVKTPGSQKKECKLRSVYNGDCPVKDGINNFAYPCDVGNRDSGFYAEEGMERSKFKGPLKCVRYEEKKLWGWLPSKFYGKCKAR